MKPRLTALVSGSGSTVEAVIRASVAGDVDYEIGQIISSRRDAGIFERMKNLNQELGLNIPCILINHHTYPPLADETLARGGQSISEQQALIAAIESIHSDIVMLLGYMKRIGPLLIEKYGWHPEYTSPYQAVMLNTNPGLLPATKGTYGPFAQQRTLDLGLKEGGQTFHVVAEDYDDGPTIAEHRVAVKPGDTIETLFARVQIAEKKYLPKDIDTFIKARQAFLST
jgi:phosphoribosylglycinamide formyltransferase-1